MKCKNILLCLIVLTFISPYIHRYYSVFTVYKSRRNVFMTIFFIIVRAFFSRFACVSHRFNARKRKRNVKDHHHRPKREQQLVNGSNQVNYACTSIRALIDKKNIKKYHLLCFIGCDGARYNDKHAPRHKMVEI